MNTSSVLAFGMAYGGLGTLAYAFDQRYGVGVRGWFIDLASPEPREHTQGFLVARGAPTQALWALGLAAALGAASLAVSGGPWYAQVPPVAAGSLALWAGMQVLPGARALGSLASAGLRRLREAGSRIRARLAAARSPEEADASPPPAPPSAPQRRRARIEAMDQILGRESL